MSIAESTSRRTATLLLISLLSWAVASCSSGESDSVRIGAVLALTGSGANYGKSLKQGIELAVEEVNADGGIKGKKVVVVFEDSQGDAKTGISAFNKLATVDKVPLVLGSISSVVLALAPIADERRIVLVNTSAISPKICERADKYLFSLMVDGAAEAEFMAAEISTKYRGQPVAVLFSNNASGIDTKDVFVRQFSRVGGVMSAIEGYELGAQDFRTQLAKIKRSGAKLVYLIAFSSQEFANVLIQAKELALDVQWFSYSGFETKETLELAGNAAEGVLYSYPQYDPRNVAFSNFQEKYLRSYGSWADIYTVTSYDAIKLLTEVIQRNGTEPSAIRNGLKETTGYQGIFGAAQWRDVQCLARSLMRKQVRQGKFVPLQ